MSRGTEKPNPGGSGSPDEEVCDGVEKRAVGKGTSQCDCLSEWRRDKAWGGRGRAWHCQPALEMTERGGVKSSREWGFEETQTLRVGLKNGWDLNQHGPKDVAWGKQAEELWKGLFCKNLGITVNTFGSSRSSLGICWPPPIASPQREDCFAGANHCSFTPLPQELHGTHKDCNSSPSSCRYPCATLALTISAVSI